MNRTIVSRPRAPARYRPFKERHPQLLLALCACCGVILLIPFLTRPTVALELVVGAIGVWIAWRTPAIPLALGGLPTLIDAVYGSDPLPKGGFTFVFSVWI